MSKWFLFLKKFCFGLLDSMRQQSMRQQVRCLVRRLFNFLDNKLKPSEPLRIPPQKQHLRKEWSGLDNRFHYQEKYNTFDIGDEDVVLDIGSGHKPFPYATILGDRFLEITNHRHTKLVFDERPMVIFNVEHLPFEKKSIDFIFCSHVLEHVTHPKLACDEMVRVGKRGYIETPTIMKDAIFAWARNMHKWFLVARGNTLVFFEYSDRELRGIDTTFFQEITFDECFHPFQKVFKDNQDIFNTMFNWLDSFEVHVYREESTKESY